MKPRVCGQLPLLSGGSWSGCKVREAEERAQPVLGQEGQLLLMRWGITASAVAVLAGHPSYLVTERLSQNSAKTPQEGNKADLELWFQETVSSGRSMKQIQ